MVVAARPSCLPAALEGAGRAGDYCMHFCSQLEDKIPRVGSLESVLPVPVESLKGLPAMKVAYLLYLCQFKWLCATLFAGEDFPLVPSPWRAE